MAQNNLTDAQRRVQKVLDACMDTVIAYCASEVPPLGNYTPAGIVDLLGRLNEGRKLLEKTEKILKERTTAVLDGAKEQRGDNYVYSKSLRPRYALDQTKAKAKLEELGGKEALDECMVESQVETVTIKPLA